MKRYNDSGARHIANTVQFLNAYSVSPDTADSFAESIVKPMDDIIRRVAEALHAIAEGDSDAAALELEQLLSEYAEDAPPVEADREVQS